MSLLLSACKRRRDWNKRRYKVLTWLPHLRDMVPTRKEKGRIRENKLHFLGHLSKRCRINKIRRSLVSFARMLVIWRRHVPNTPLSLKRKGCLRSRMSTDGEKYIYVGNGNKATVKVIGVFRLQLDSECTLDLDETFVVP